MKKITPRQPDLWDLISKEGIISIIMGGIPDTTEIDDKFYELVDKLAKKCPSTKQYEIEQFIAHAIQEEYSALVHNIVSRKLKTDEDWQGVIDNTIGVGGHAPLTRDIIDWEGIIRTLARYGTLDVEVNSRTYEGVDFPEVSSLSLTSNFGGFDCPPNVNPQEWEDEIGDVEVRLNLSTSASQYSGMDVSLNVDNKYIAFADQYRQWLDITREAPQWDKVKLQKSMEKQLQSYHLR